MGSVYADLIHEYVTYGTETGYHCIADVKEKYQEKTRVAYKKKFGVDAPETE